MWIYNIITYPNPACLRSLAACLAAGQVIVSRLGFVFETESVSVYTSYRRPCFTRYADGRRYGNGPSMGCGCYWPYVLAGALASSGAAKVVAKATRVGPAATEKA